MSQRYQDFKLAQALDERINSLGLTENATLPKPDERMDYKPRTLIDQTLELIDPTPNIHTLFVQFNQHFFWNVLLPVEVKWSNRMTSCAGICSYHPRNRQCIITLSAPLLKLRPRKDLVETLLHEMIHGYLFLTNNNRDRDGHGPEFCKHMHRINSKAGTNITIYHSFHDEVKLYKQHWWRCDGPCHKQAPYFGTVRRAMNRAPGPSDFWWREHQQACGGKFIKIKEPEKVNTKNTKSNTKVNLVTKNINNNENLLGWLTQSDNTLPKSSPKAVMLPETSKNSISGGVIKKSDKTKNEYLFTVRNSNKTIPFKSPSLSGSKLAKSVIKDITNNGPNTSLKAPLPTGKNDLSDNIAPGIRKLGNTANNVHGWSVGGPNSSGSFKNISNKSSTPRFSCSESLGGTNSGKTNLLDKFYKNAKQCNNIKNTNSNPKKPSNTENVLRPLKSTDNATPFPDKHNVDFISCPICGIFTYKEDINQHLDVCLQDSHKDSNKLITDNNLISECSTATMEQPSIVEKRKSPVVMVPAKRVKTDELNKLKYADCPICQRQIELTKINDHLDNCLSQSKNEKVEDNEDKNSPHQCLVCNSIIPLATSLNEHLEDCVGSIFRDESSDMIDLTEEKNVNMIKYPCPVCMELYSDESMNVHLDKCLKMK